MKYMTRIFYLVLIFTFVSSETSCDNNSTAKPIPPVQSQSQTGQKIIIVNTDGPSIIMRFNPPVGFERKPTQENSFQEYLRYLPLKAHGELVKYYNGDTKLNQGVYIAVVDLPIGKKDLHQCADAVMRLRMDYLYSQQRFDDIHFNFTNGFRVEYSEYMKGKRMVVSGNKTYWKQTTSPSNTPKDFIKYKELIYSYAGTLSLSKELKAVSINNMQIGDVFIKGGSPGHTVIIVDMVVDDVTNEKLFMLAQSYMPAQEIQILVNPTNDRWSPWYSTKNLDYLQTPEWSFEINELMSF